MSGHGGNTKSLAAKAGIPEENLLDFSANINPLGAPSWLRSVISRHLDSLEAYPDPSNSELLEAISKAWQVPTTKILAGNGANELIYALPRALDIERVIVCPPAYIDYKNAALAANCEVYELCLNSDFSVNWNEVESQSRAGDLLVLAHPNNPTGTLQDRTRLIRFLQERPEVYLMLDEAFIDFIGIDSSFIHENFPQLIIIRSFTKFYAIPGLRLGCMIADATVIEQVKKKICDWSVNRLAQVVGIAAVADTDYEKATIRSVNQYRKALIQDLQALDSKLMIYPSTVNYLLCRLHKGSARKLANSLLKNHGIAIRICDNYKGLDESYFRIAVKAPKDNERLVKALKSTLRERPHPKKVKAHPSLMIQGTSSNAGKSLITAAFCRILLQDGLKVSPFKSQNMALNSFVTHDGLEIARAQVVQAQAARLDPDIRMNPILLKPNGNRLTQVIVNGKVVKDMSWKDYIQYKPTAFQQVKESYRSLCDDHDAIILEGAGSPAEVNLKHSDIVNMGMASFSQSPVLLAGDIDRGGLFASFIGTMDILTPHERQLVCGFLVNRFRGDVSLLQEALDFTFNHTGKPVLGVIPHIPLLNLPEEDSLSYREVKFSSKKTSEIEIVLIDTPHLSNFTDFDPLTVEPDVNLRVIQQASEIGNADLIILPGSKSTVADLLHLRKHGFEPALNAAKGRGVHILGICGGFQILGKEILDPQAIESDHKSINALGFLKVSTTMAPAKTLKQVTTKFKPTQTPISGYEIHHGETLNLGSEVIIDSGSSILGLAHERVWGTYLHGIFDDDKFRRSYLNQIRTQKELDPIETISEYNLEPALDRLADAVRANVNMKEIYKKMGL